MQDLDDKILSGNTRNGTWHLCLLPTLAKDCVLSFQLPYNQIATSRQTLWRQRGGFLSGFLFTPWITTKALHTQSCGCALLRNVFSLWKETCNHFTPSVLYCIFIIRRMNLNHLCFTKILFWQLSRATSDRQFLLSNIARRRVKEFFASSSWTRCINGFPLSPVVRH